MKRNRFNEAKLVTSTISKARQLFLEKNDNTDTKNTYIITNIHAPIDEKDVAKKV